MTLLELWEKLRAEEPVVTYSLTGEDLLWEALTRPPASRPGDNLRERGTG